MGARHNQKNGDEAGTKKFRPVPVEYIHIGLLLGWVADAVTGIVMGLDGVEVEKKVEIVRAYNKFWWIQNDLFAKHYVQG